MGVRENFLEARRVGGVFMALLDGGSKFFERYGSMGHFWSHQFRRLQKNLGLSTKTKSRSSPAESSNATALSAVATT